MGTKLSVEVLAPGALTLSERALWRSFTAASSAYRSPFFSLDFALAADGVAPGAAVAVVERAGAVVGFLPFQRRGRAAQPLGAPLSDYHGLIAAPGADVDLREVIRLTGCDSYRFNGLVGPAPPKSGRCFAHAALKADVSAGLEAWLSARPSTRKFFKDKERARRAAERDLGALEFRMEDDADLLSFVIANKRDQYRRTARHDVFACGWTRDLLRRLWAERTAEFGGRLATLRAGGRLLAAELDLRAGPVRHIWFPTYDPDVARWGPGTLLMISLFKAAAEDPGLTELDFGSEGEAYKRHYADAAEPVYEGGLDLDGWRRVSCRAADAALAAAPALTRVAEVRERMRRRFEIITACETRPAAWLGGAADAFVKAGRRGPALSSNA